MTRSTRIATWLLIAIGLSLSLLSATDLCNFGGCTDAHQYRLFGMKLHLIGTAFFLAFAALQLVRQSPPLLGDLLLGGGVGAEITFIHLQKNVIQAWCPLCLGIATVVGLLVLVRVIGVLSTQRKTIVMTGNFFGKAALLLAATAISFSLSLVGMTKSEAQASDLNIALGKQNSKVEVYVFSDWFCPSCIKAEPAIKAAFPTIAKKAKVQFIDKAIHAEAMNFVPFHLSFAAKEKDKYIELRRALFDLAKRTKNPTAKDVDAAVAPLKVTYKQLSFLEVTQTMGRFQALSDQFKVKGTPTIIITNSATKKTRTLYGANEISTEAIIKAVRELE